MASSIATKRLQKEYRDLKASPPVGITVEDTSDLFLWTIVMRGAPDTLYASEVFYLQFKYSNNYPMESPEVVFVRSIPVHPHVYSNGHICLSILYDQWSPALTCQSVCLSIQSMLSSCTKKVRPDGNDLYVLQSSKSPKKTQWQFHDDKC